MDYEETMVEENFDDVEADDTLPDDIVEEDESEEDFPAEDELEIPDEEEEEPEAEEEPEPQPKTEPGWIKQRVNKAVEKAVRETEARMQAMFDQQMKPIRDKMMEDEAQELVRSRKVTDIDTARELVRLRNGMQPSEQRAEQPRNEQGQFASQEQIVSAAKTDARINELAKQADKIKAKGGPDVVKEFLNNKEVKARVISGELDFYDVAEMMSKPKKRPPSPSRSSNGANNPTPNSFATMSSEQFARMERNIERGARYKLN